MKAAAATLDINGERREVNAPPVMPLLWAFCEALQSARENLGLT